MSSYGLEPNDVLARLAAIRFDEHDLTGVLSKVAHLAQEALPGASEVSVTLVRNQKPFTAVHTGERCLALDEVQYTEGHGPCVDVAQASGTVLVSDMGSETRWPRFSARAVELGMSSSLSLALPIQQALVGALNVYGEQRDAFDSSAIDLAVSFAGYAAVAVANAHLFETTQSLAENMKIAMDSRAAIEQAKGIIMCREGVDEATAFGRLSTTSQNTNRKLREVAADLIAEVVQPSH